jgi:hypothetical protein
LRRDYRGSDDNRIQRRNQEFSSVEFSVGDSHGKFVEDL